MLMIKTGWQMRATNRYSSCARKQHELLIQSWKLTISEIEITYDDKENKMIYDGHTLPCLHTDGYCKPTIQTPYTLVWFHEEFCLIFRLQEFVGRMTKIENRYRLETDSFTKTPYTQDLPSTDGIRTTKHPYM